MVFFGFWFLYYYEMLWFGCLGFVVGLWFGWLVKLLVCFVVELFLCVVWCLVSLCLRCFVLFGGLLAFFVGFLFGLV